MNRIRLSVGAPMLAIGISVGTLSSTAEPPLDSDSSDSQAERADWCASFDPFARQFYCGPGAVGKQFNSGPGMIRGVQVVGMHPHQQGKGVAGKIVNPNGATLKSFSGVSGHAHTITIPSASQGNRSYCNVRTNVGDTNYIRCGWL